MGGCDKVWGVQWVEGWEVCVMPPQMGVWFNKVSLSLPASPNTW